MAPKKRITMHETPRPQSLSQCRESLRLLRQKNVSCISVSRHSNYIGTILMYIYTVRSMDSIPKLNPGSGSSGFLVRYVLTHNTQ